jgi:hypothetical protein
MKSLQISLLWLVFALAPATGLAQLEDLTPTNGYSGKDWEWLAALMMSAPSLPDSSSGFSGMSVRPTDSGPSSSSSGMWTGFYTGPSSTASTQTGTIPSVLDDLRLPSTGSSSSYPTWTGFYLGSSSMPSTQTGTIPSVLDDLNLSPSGLSAAGTIPSVLDDLRLPSTGSSSLYPTWTGFYSGSYSMPSTQAGGQTSLMFPFISSTSSPMVTPFWNLFPDASSATPQDPLMGLHVTYTIDMSGPGWK